MPGAEVFTAALARRVEGLGLELVVEDIKDFVRGTFLEDQPVIPVSSVTGPAKWRTSSALVTGTCP